MKLHVAAAGAASVAAMLFLSSCSSSPKIEGIPDKLPDIQLSGRTSTPSHSMASSEYPFDEKGRYVTDWAAQGERSAGRSAAANSSDVSKWSGSYGGAATGKKRVVVKTTKPKSGSSSSRSTVASRSGTSKSTASSSSSASKKGKTASRRGGGSYVVKKGDTLSGIARRNSTTVAKIKAANGMSSDFLSIGKVLRMP